ncbi:MAG: Holliday junction branch migration protein RuvA [Puniceicoccales bacterium]|jgi:Holliday junction DNA helicase RuvA|nr:Holliday junction branch migration protein RuvA [Puniceicoccales bacterium]
MIVSLNGTLIESGIFRAVVECAGIGYEVHIPVTTAEKLPPAGGAVRLHTLQIFRDDDQSLYGFASVEERDFFRLLIEKVSGIGPKTALNIFSRLSLPVLKDAIARSDVKLLSDCPGIGKKTAERLVIELRDKILPGSGRDASVPSAIGAVAAQRGPSLQNDAVAALVTLGIKPADADKYVRAALEKLGNSVSVETLIRTALGGGGRN